MAVGGDGDEIKESIYECSVCTEDHSNKDMIRSSKIEEKIKRTFQRGEYGFVLIQLSSQPPLFPFRSHHPKAREPTLAKCHNLDLGRE